jgi:hypothetical protein
LYALDIEKEKCHNLTGISKSKAKGNKKKEEEEIRRV